MSYVITCGDEGVQLNQGTRIGIAGAGFRVPQIEKVITALKKVLGEELYIASSDENDWTKDVLNLKDWDQVNAIMQQHIQALADREGLKYAGHIPFADPQPLEYDIKAHMVRPHNVHVGKQICLTLGGGEQKYHLGSYVVSADWVAKANSVVVKEAIGAQVAFYEKLAKKALPLMVEESGPLGEKIIQANKAKLIEAGFKIG